MGERTAVRLGKIGRLGVAFAQVMVCMGVAVFILFAVIGALHEGSRLAVALVGAGLAGAILGIGVEQALKVGRQGKRGPGRRGAKDSARHEDSVG